MNNIILRYFTLHLKNVLERSQKFAESKERQKQAGVAEILRAVAWEKGSIGFNLLKDLTAFEDMKRNVGREDKRTKDNKLRASRPFSQEAHEVILGAIKTAQEFQFPYVGTEHLLFAILENCSQETFSLLGKNKPELKNLLEQLKKIMSKSINPSEEPLIFINHPRKLGKAEAFLTNEEGLKQEYFQEVMGEISELFSSILKKRKGKESNSFSPNVFPSLRPSFGVVMPHQQKSERFLDYFGHDLNKEILQGKIDPVIGREQEIENMVCILMRKLKNNPVLVGEPGVGKTAIVAGLAQKIVEKEVPPTLVGKRVVTLDMGLLVAGTSFRGEFEDRFKRVLEEVENDPNIILFIDELHNLVGAGSAQGSLDAANIIKPALARGSLRCIGATTIEEYHRFIEKDGALERRFQSVRVQEPSQTETVQILRGIRRFYEEFHNVKISDRAIAEATRLASRYINDRFLPDKAIDLLDESAAYVIQDEHRQGTTKKLQKLESQREKIRQMKERMVLDNNLEMAANFLENEKDLSDIIDTLRKKVAKERQLIPVVDEHDVAEVLSRKLSLPLELVTESPTERLVNLSRTLKHSIRGQSGAIDKITATLRRLLVGIADPERPATAMLFVGPTGVGKTYTAKLMAKELFVKPDSLVRVDMSEFNEKHTISRLLGSPPGYVGYGELNSFTDKIRKNPYSLILFDEIEKAHPEIFHVLLQVLEDGFLTDSTGRKVNFRNAIIIFTSNLGNEEFIKRAMGFAESGQPMKLGKREKVGVKRQLEDFLRPEFINRLTNIVFFKPLAAQEMAEIATLEIRKLKKRLLATKNIKLEVEKELSVALAAKSVNAKEGTRMLRRLIQRKIEEPIAQEIITGKIRGGTKVFFARNKPKSKTAGKYGDVRIRIVLPPEPELVGETKKSKPNQKATNGK